MTLRHHGAEAAIRYRERVAKMLRAASRTKPRRVFVDQTVIEAQRARMVAHRIATARRAGVANAEVEAIARNNGAVRVTGTERDGDIVELARRRVDHLADQLDAVTSLAELNSLVRSLDGRAFRFAGDRSRAEQLAGMIKRARCVDWWTRQLSRASARKQEAAAMRAGRLGQFKRESYCTDDAVRARARQNARSRRMLESSWIESDDGEEVNLMACFEASTSHKPIRRGELMTRIRGCEEWAEERRLAGLFTTNTAPSRFHSTGGTNPKYRGRTPTEAQAWLSRAWARCRAKLQRLKLPIFGFRVAEPHEDGCPHWHMLIWTKPEHAAEVERVMKAEWLGRPGWVSYGCRAEREGMPKLFTQPRGASRWERGALEHRCKVATMEPGGATGYIAKYISKNIDDVGAVGVEGHRDDWESDGSAQADMFGGNAARVEAWAARWGIRQFQPLGQPPVTVWRELRRVDRKHEASAPLRVSFAMNGAHRVGDERACWHTFLKAMGGVNVGREYLIRLAVLRTEHQGKYETVEKAKPLGVFEAGNPAELVPSVRKEWRPRGSRGRTPSPSEVGVRAAGKTTHGRGATTKRSPPWTRFNNCTREGFRDIVSELLQRCDSGRYRPESAAPWPPN